MSELVPEIIKCAECVLNELGPTHSEQTFQNALEIELQERKLLYQRQPTLTIYYKKRAVGFHRPDLIIEDKVIVELKSRKNDKTEYISEQWESQVNQYIQCMHDKSYIGLLIIFNSSGKLTVKCTQNDTNDTINDTSYNDKSTTIAKPKTKKVRSLLPADDCINISMPESTINDFIFESFKK